MGLARLTKKAILAACSIVAAIFLVLAVLIFTFAYATRPWHDFAFSRMERALATLEAHPPSSYVVARKEFFGSRYIDQEECSYFVGEIRHAPLSRTEILHSYEAKSVNLLGFAHDMPIKVEIIEEGISLPLDDPADEWTREFWNRFGTTTSDGTYYVAYLFEVSRSWFGDSRCYERQEKILK